MHRNRRLPTAGGMAVDEMATEETRTRSQPGRRKADTGAGQIPASCGPLFLPQTGRRDRGPLPATPQQPRGGSPALLPASRLRCSTPARPELSAENPPATDSGSTSAVRVTFTATGIACCSLMASVLPSRQDTGARAAHRGTGPVPRGLARQAQRHRHRQMVAVPAFALVIRPTEPLRRQERRPARANRRALRHDGDAVRLDRQAPPPGCSNPGDATI